MKFGLRYCNTGRYVDPARAIELMQAAEAAGRYVEDLRNAAPR